MELTQKRTQDNMAFPFPHDGARSEVNPPWFNWLPEEGISRFTIIIERRIDGEWRPFKRVETDEYVLIFRELFPPGAYRWDLRDQADEGHARGWWEFFLPGEAAEIIVPEAADVLAGLPDHHPRHVYYPGDIPGVRAEYETELGVLRKNVAMALKTLPPARPVFHRPGGKPVYRDAFGAYRDSVDRDLVALALGYLLLGNRAAGDRAKEHFMTIMDWNPNGPCSVLGPWGDEIGLSNSRTLFSLYDWLYPLFDEKEHDYVRRTLVQYALLIEELLVDQNFAVYPGRSHSGRIPAYLGEAALVLHGMVDPALTERWLDYALKIYGTLFPHFGRDDGGWAEGVFYASSYTKWYLPFFFALERHSGFSFLQKPFYKRVSHYFIHFAPPGRDTHPFCDGHWCQSDDVEWPGFMAQDPFRAYAERFGPDLARDFSRRLSTPRYYKLHLLDIFRPLMPGGAEGRTETFEEVRQSRLFPQTGLAAVHTCVERPEEDTALLFRASPFGAVSHEHADQGNIALIHRNRTLIGPSGYFGFSCGSPHHRLWARQTKAHNCLLFNGRGQEGEARLITGQFLDLADEDDLKGSPGSKTTVVMDLTEAYNKGELPLTRYVRTVTFTRPGSIVITDELELTEPVSVDVRYHSNFAPEISGSKARISSGLGGVRIRVSYDDQPLDLTCTDRFETPVNQGIPEENHVAFPDQHHMNWRLEGFARGVIVTEMEIRDE